MAESGPSNFRLAALIAQAKTDLDAYVANVEQQLALEIAQLQGIGATAGSAIAASDQLHAWYATRLDTIETQLGITPPPDPTAGS